MAGNALNLWAECHGDIEGLLLNGVTRSEEADYFGYLESIRSLQHRPALHVSYSRVSR